jgi:hypothetical protein
MTPDQVTAALVLGYIMMGLALCGVVLRCLTLLDAERHRANRAVRDAVAARADANTWAGRARKSEADAARLHRPATTTPEPPAETKEIPRVDDRVNGTRPARHYAGGAT